ncbi:MAG: hypothetical protein JO097_02590 [Acidobacteriaceae bacterium]|nr:hypothetical protein [Acidobacteriaceae bacterium]MBV9294971.1 hypothetical protein [Acidobacteriaceae bacterium]
MASNVIKARMLASVGRPVIIKRSVQMASQDASEIIAQAQDEAQQIVSEAQKKAQSISDSAREDGYQTSAAQWYDALAQARESRDRYLAANETALLKLAVRIAEKLIGQELRTSPDTVLGIVKEALRSARRAASIVIHAHPADAVLLNERISALRKLAGLTREIEIIPDAGLSRGDCVVESEIGVIDARLDTQLKNIERVLTKVST